MNKICNLSYDEFKTYGEVKEGFPHYEKNLIAYYPFDKDTKNIVPEVELYIENNQIKIDGLKKENAIINHGTTIENGMIKFAGDSSSYMAINTSIFNKDKTYKIEVEYQPKGDRDECILFIGDKDSINPYYNLWNNGSLQQASLRRLNGDELFSIDVSKVGDSIPNKINKATIYVKNENLIITYINDRFVGMHVNTMDKKPNKVYPITDSNYFSGYIKSMTINTFDNLDMNDDKNIEVYDCGFITGTAKTNVTTSTGLYAVTWTPEENIFFDKTKKSIYGMPVYNIRIKPTTAELLDRVKNSAWSCGVVSSAVTVEQNQDCCSFILYRPLTFKGSARVNGQPSNNINWLNGKTIDLENGWKLAYKYRNPNNQQLEQTDGCHWSFYSPEIEMNEELIVECSPVITMKDTQVPTLLTYNNSQSKGPNTIRCNPKIINDNINEFALSYEWIPVSHTTDTEFPQHLWLGGWTADQSADWVGVYYRGRGWSNASLAHLDCNTKINKKNYGLGSINNFEEVIGHKIKVVVSYKKSTKTLRILAYDKTVDKLLSTSENNEIEFTNFDNFSVNNSTNDLMKNLCIFNISFTMDEMIGMCKKDFKILEDGSFNVDNLYEEIAYNKRNAYYVPLDMDTESVCGRLDIINANNLFDASTISDGYVFNDGLVKPPLNADFTSDFIAVKENEKYIFEVLKNTKENTPAVAWFDSNKTIIKRDIKAITADTKWIITSPNKARFARITSRWKNEVKIIFKEKEHRKIDSSYQQKDGGIIAGDINYKAMFNLTPIERAPKLDAKTNNVLFDEDSLSYPNWNNGFNSGVENPTVGYHAKWVNEGPRRNSCVKFINHNSAFGMQGRWLGVNYTISDLLNPIGLAHGDRINISFMAKSDVDGSNLQIGIHRQAISTGQNSFNKLYNINLTTYWKEYSIEIPVDSDWALNHYASLYFYGNILDQVGESVKWVSDIYMVVNGPKKIYPSCLKAIKSTPIEYNLTETIDMDWSKPWHISFWKKGFGKSRGQENFNVWSLGTVGNMSSNSKGYIYSGILYDNMITNSINSRTLDDEQNNHINEDNYFDNWIFYTISYDGTKISLRTRGEKIYSELEKDITIDRKNYFKDDAQEADLFLTTCRGSYSNNSAIKDLLILKNETLTIDQENEMFRTLIKSTHNLNTRIIISEE